MARKCIFCDEIVDSREHVWPEWVLERLPPQKISGFVGRHKNLKFSREFTVGCVCQRRCNGGWMSELERANIPILGEALMDKSMFLDSLQQRTIAAWAVKTAMVLEATIPGTEFTFYSASERQNMRSSWSIPERTAVWLGRYLGVGLGAWQSGLLGHYPDDPGRYPIRASTILMGSLVIQVLCGRVPDKHRHPTVPISPAQGPWNEILVEAWPSTRQIYWPPVLAFDESRTIVGIHNLPARWRLGREVKPFE
jgi:hypothetical protein